MCYFVDNINTWESNNVLYTRLKIRKNREKQKMTASRAQQRTCFKVRAARFECFLSPQSMQHDSRKAGSVGTHKTDSGQLTLPWSSMSRFLSIHCTISEPEKHTREEMKSRICFATWSICDERKRKKYWSLKGKTVGINDLI